MRAPALLLLLAAAAANRTRPHIVIIIADDLGWNDVGFHGMAQVPTPNMDALAAGGRVLQRHYVLPLCSPSRAALLTGRYPIHTGMQHGVLYGAEPRGLAAEERLLPQLLAPLGYRAHLVGKWHLGSAAARFLPLSRGFESHTGFWTGKIDMFDHINDERGSWGFDFRRGYTTAYDLYGKYATHVYTEEAIKVIEAHPAGSPLLLVVAHSAVHSGSPADPLRAPPAALARFAHIRDTARRHFAGMLHELDASVGAVAAALGARGLLRDAVLLLTTDNGGAPAGFNLNAGSNYPLRGTKGTLWEGGVRGAAVVWSPRLRGGGGGGGGGAVTAPMHLVDWLPTLYAAAGADPSTLTGLDGRNMWPLLSGEGAAAGEGEGEGEERTLLLNIDPADGTAALLRGRWKLLQGSVYGGRWDGWWGPAGEGDYDPAATLASPAARALAALAPLPAPDQLMRMREEWRVRCGAAGAAGAACEPARAACLFDVHADPCERDNLAHRYPGVVSALRAALAAFNASAVPPGNRPLAPAGDPARWGRVYVPFLDYPAHPAPACR